MVIDGDVDEKERDKESERCRELYMEQRQACVRHFEKWSETQQVEFVEYLLSKMCHYQHGHINTYLKPMLQRDFITALPGKFDYALVRSRHVCLSLLDRLKTVVSSKVRENIESKRILNPIATSTKLTML